MSIVSPGCKLFAAGLIGEQWKEKKRKEEKNWRFLLFMTCEEDKERKEITYLRKYFSPILENN